MDSRVFVVAGGQYGSEGKGAVAGRIASDLGGRDRRVVAVRVGGPNAGHTVLGDCPTGCDLDHGPASDQHPWRLRQVPVAAVTNVNADLVIAAGSEIDPPVLLHEIQDLNAAGYRVSERLVIDSRATVIADKHKEQEVTGNLTGRLGSTAKGIGAARAALIWRTAGMWHEFRRNAVDPAVYGREADIQATLWGELRVQNDTDPADVVIEGTQGYALGLHAGHYPFATSGDCRAIDFLAQAGVSPWLLRPEHLRVVVCYRPYPIRVAGNSGPMHAETSWQALGLPQELTTVTQKVRRVGGWDSHLAKRSMKANGAPSPNVWAALTMMDQVLPHIAGQDNLFETRILGTLEPRERAVVGDYLQDLVGARLAYLGTGPDSAIVDGGLYE